MKEDKGAIEDVDVVGLLQRYDDGRADKIWNVGDMTTNGTILSFSKNVNGLWMAITDTPSEWQKNNGMTNRWSWVFELKEI
jgi:hypothetical protein